ncbi:type I restriction enzyme S subunit [Oceanisphaera litoralis]|uniref:restriction endonuclease subunit S n=1 Tax=Oceanisphaera litoralis TaxID=225144 RepID=UPI00195D7A7B|nr:restriction endonuclease subunit S [Oceanisphaera litoralis]MBM7456615.1 type I restriction enzyme S subunit [Oceanisphaera litoralis]
MMKLSAMPTYEAYKDSGVEWLGEIPAHWSIIRFRDFFKFGRGLTITKENLQDEGIPCVSYGEIHSKYGFEVTPQKHYLKCVSEDYLIKGASSLLNKGDFIFADTSEDIEGSGNFSQLITDDVVFAGYHVVICRPIGEGNHRYLAYCLDSVSYRKQIKQQIKGVKVYSITQSILKNTKIWLPKLEEQTLITNFLDQKAAQIDEAIAIKEQQIELIKERKQIIIQQAVTQGLDPKVPMKDSGVEWIGQIPEHWEVKRLKYVLKERSERSKTGEEPLFMVSQVHGLVVRADFHEKAAVAASNIDNKIVHKNDLVFNKLKAHLGVFFKSNIDYQGLVSPDYAVYKCEDYIVDSKYLELLFRHPSYIAQFVVRATGVVEGLIRLHSLVLKLDFLLINNKMTLLQYRVNTQAQLQ